MKKKQSPYALHISILFLFAALFTYVKLPPVGAAGIVYVDVDSTCSSSCGGSWAEAHPNLQDALATAVSGDQIWVTQGIYYPDIGGGMSPNDRSATFTLLNGVAIYGGFAGNESSLDERNITANPTLLSGDIEKNDITDPGGVVTDTTNIVGDNVYHVLVGSGVDNTAVLDGFTITAGQANGTDPNYSGGGMFNDNGSPTLTNLTFSGNSANANGGGMYNANNSRPALTNVIFSHNSTNSLGGGMYNIASSPTLTDVIFNSNSASSFGGGMSNSSSAPIMTNVTFSDNSANGSGGGLSNGDSSPTLTNVTFDNNNANINGGGIYSTNSSQITLTNVDFNGNNANYGGGIYNLSSSPTLTNVTFTGNTAATYGSGMYNNFSDPELANVTFDGNNGTTQGGGIYNTSSNPILTNVTFSNNSASSYGGGMRNHTSSPSLTNVTFSGNSAGSYGGGMYNVTSSPTLVNITFSNNSAGYGGGGLYNFSGSPTLKNVIIANSTDGGDCGNNIDGSVASNSSHNLIEDSGSNACDLVNGADNNIIGEDPALGPLQNNGGSTQTHGLLSGSPAINAGDNTVCPVADQRGIARPQPAAGQCDIGAVERDETPPTILAISRADSTPTTAASVNFIVTFSEIVAGVDTADFSLITTGTLTNTAIANITGIGATYTVTVSTGAGGGSLRLDLPAVVTVADLEGNALSSAPYTGGEMYTILGIKAYLPMLVR